MCQVSGYVTTLALSNTPLLTRICSVYTTEFSKEGRSMPYLRVGDPDTGEEISDSNLIIERLAKDFEVSDSKLSTFEKAVTHTSVRMIEEHLCQIGFYFRYGLNMKAFVDSLHLEDRWDESLEMWVRFQPNATIDKTRKRGLLRHSDETLWSMSNDDIQALSDMLGDGEYFFGGLPTLIDCTVFGHLSQFLWLPLDFPQKAYIKERCPNLVRFMTRFREQYWPDWESRCKKQSNQKVARSSSSS